MVIESLAEHSRRDRGKQPGTTLSLHHSTRPVRTWVLLQAASPAPQAPGPHFRNHSHRTFWNLNIIIAVAVTLIRMDSACSLLLSVMGFSSKAMCRRVVGVWHPRPVLMEVRKPRTWLFQTWALSLKGKSPAQKPVPRWATTERSIRRSMICLNIILSGWWSDPDDCPSAFLGISSGTSGWFYNASFCLWISLCSNLWLLLLISVHQLFPALCKWEAAMRSVASLKGIRAHYKVTDTNVRPWVHTWRLQRLGKCLTLAKHSPTVKQEKWDESGLGIF